MSKILILISFLITFTSQVHGSIELASRLYDGGKYYAAYTMLKKSINKNTRNEAKSLAYKLIDRIHPAVFKNDSDLNRLFDKSTPLNYAVAIRAFYLGDLRSTEKFLYHIKKDHPSNMEVNYLRGMIYYIKNDFNASARSFKKCYIAANKKSRNTLKTDDYIHAFSNRCIQQLSRIFFEKKNYRASLKYLRKVKKTDFVWPRLLFDKAWNYYWLNKYPQTLGTLVSYKASYLKKFMLPEANYLRALTYYDLCYYKKAERIYDEFLGGIYKEKKLFQSMTTRELKKIIFKRKSSKQKSSDRFIISLLKGYRKDTKFFSFRSAMTRLKSETKLMKKYKSNEFKKIVLELKKYQAYVRLDFDNFLLSLTRDYYKQIERTNKKFLRLKLGLGIRRQKNIIKKSQTTFKDDFVDLDLSQIDNLDEKFIWEFKGGFWADELGDYAVALRSQCSEA
ncbi:MAG: hypothetical protein HN576_06495 [Bacteriovoracaceae bacterium]|jgi:hypothetical protein|nr:hypothetical protein [Bacteriovoracaceae bacterium]